ncbi:MAG: cytochrome c biogenesis protein CcsA [Anaeromyxobacter sp.]
MTQTLRTIASLKLAVVLLVLLLIGLATGTIIESTRGAELAQAAVYYSWWFIALQAAFAVNVLASIIVHFPWGRWRIGFLLTHAGILVTLAGAILTWAFGVSGRLPLWEGEASDQFVVVDGGQPIGRVELPFTVKLDDFQLDRYPGTMRPAQFRSLVQVTDKATGVTTAERIWMNHPLHVQGFTLFQSSYDQDGGRESSTFEVSRDPGQPVAFAGYALLLVGMVVVLATRISQEREKAAAQAEARERASARAGRAGVVAAVLLGLGLGGAARADAVSPADLEALRRVPVQHDGRTMPLDTQAREAVWKITGQRRFQGEDPVLTATRWLYGTSTATERVIKLDRALVRQLGLATDHVSYQELAGSAELRKLLGQAHLLERQGVKRTGVLAAAEKAVERANELEDYLRHEAVRVIPVAGDPRARWGVAPFATAADLAQLARGPRLTGWPSAVAVERELSYNASRPSRVAWLVLLGALLVSIAAWVRRSRALDVVSLLGLVAGFGVMSWGIWVRWQVGDRIPAANMYESLLFLAWGVGLFAVLAFAVLRNRLVVANACGMAALTMALTDLLPMDGFIHPIAPVLTGTPWLAIHVPIIMVGYAVLALSMVIAHVQVGCAIFAPKQKELASHLYGLNYWYMHVGNILLLAGILTGSVWAASSWGRYWGWDPKEVWSLVAFLAYMAILHGKVEKLLGEFGVAAIGILAFQTILMTYLGVNFVLGTGMHAYGMGDSPIVFWMVLVLVVEVAFVALGWWAHSRRRQAEAG